MNNDFTRSVDELDDLLEESWNLPIASNKYIVNGEKLKSIISEIKLNLPMEMRKSREVLENREKMLQKAKEDSDNMVKKAKKTSEMMLLKARKSAETILANARTEAETILNEQDILDIAQKRADDIIDRAKTEAAKMRSVTISYIDNMLNDSQRSLEKAVNAIEQVKKTYNEND